MKLDDPEYIIKLSEKIEKEGLNVREIEGILSKKNSTSKNEYLDPKLKIYQDTLSDALGNKVKITKKKIEINYDSIADLNRIFEIFNINIKD